jgi:hypothetical protein
VLYGWTMEVLSRSVSDRRSARHWGRTTWTVVRASVVVIAAEVASLVSRDLRIVRGSYEFSPTGIASLGFLAAIAVLTFLVARWSAPTLRIKDNLQRHFESEPLRRMRSVEQAAPTPVRR